MERNPAITSSFGLGLEIMDALQKGAKQIHIFLGGSSTNDAGTGAAEALGFKFYNTQEEEIKGLNGGKLDQISSIQRPGYLKSFSDVEFLIYTDS